MARKPKSMTDKLLKKSITEIEKTLNSLRRTIESYMPSGRPKAKAKTRRTGRKTVARKASRRAAATR
jgi:uncharacterized protein (UPF0216 family)